MPTVDDLASASVSMHDKYDQSRAYGLDKLTLELVSRTIRQCVATGLLLVGFFPYVWTLSGHVLESIGLDPEHEVPRTLVFFTITLFRDALVTLPFSLYSTFVVEARHGFNRMTLRDFFVEGVKLGIFLLLSGFPIITAMVVVVRWAGDLFFVYAPIAWAGLMTIFFGLTPAIVPFFNKVTPLADGQLHAKIRALAASQQFPVSNIVVNDNSTSSSHSNASIIGIGATKTIYLDDTLLAETSDEEVLAALCHEFGHWKKWHVLREEFLPGHRRVTVYRENVKRCILT